VHWLSKVESLIVLTASFTVIAALGKTQEQAQLT
jgi:hypothetical protein